MVSDQRPKGPGVHKARPWQAVRPGWAPSRSGQAQGELWTVVAFDIANDKVRNHAGEKCKDYGLTRVQWSVFEGPLTRNRRQELTGLLVRLIGQDPDGGRLAVYPIGDREAAQIFQWTSAPKPGAQGAGGGP